MGSSPHIVHVTAESFDRIVLDGSHDRPVLVDFWADWCAPCRALMPVLEKLAAEYGGKILVAKLNTEEEQEIAAQLGIRSLPTVQLFQDGRPVDQFMGALPEDEVRRFLKRHIPLESDGLLHQARQCLEAGDLTGAREMVEQARESEPDNRRLPILEARIKAQSGDTRGAEEMIERVPLEVADDPEVAALRGQLRFANLSADAPPEEALEQRLAADPGDSEARYQLAARLAARGDYEAALDQLLELMRRDRGYREDAARKAMVMIFDLLGGQGQLVSRYRAKMLSTLY